MPHPRIERSHRISHDIRTPLTVIREYAAILRDELGGDLNARQRNMLEVIDDRADELHQLVENLLLLESSNQRLAQADRRPFELAAMLERLLPPLRTRAERGGIDFDIQWDTRRRPTVFADESLVELFFKNVGGLTLKQRSRGDVARLCIDCDEMMVVIRADLALDSDASGDECQLANIGVGAEIARELILANLGDVQTRSAGDRVQFEARLPTFELSAVVNRYAVWLQSESQTPARAIEVIGYRLLEPSLQSRFEGLLRYSAMPGDIVAPATDGDYWIVLAALEGDRPAFGDRVRQFESEIGLETDYESLRHCIVDGGNEVELRNAVENVRDALLPMSVST